MRRIIILLFVFFSINQIVAYEKGKNTGEYLLLRNSPVFYMEKDTLIKLKFDKISKLNEKENYVDALKGALKLLEESKKEKNDFLIFKSYNLIATIYKRTNKLEKSLSYHKKSLELINHIIYEKTNSGKYDLDFAKSMLSVGTLYHNLSLGIDSTKDYVLRDSLEMFKKKIYLDSAWYFYRKIENLPSLNRETQQIKATVFNNISTIYEMDSNFVKAKDYIEKSLSIYTRYKEDLKLAKSFNNLANIYLSQKEYQKAKDIYLQGLKLIKNNTNTNAIKVKESLYFNLAWAMRNLKDYKAYDFQERSYEIQDIIREKELGKIIDEINAEYNADVREKIVRKEEENKRLRDLQAFLVIGIIGLVIIISLAYRNKLNKLKQKNQALNFSQQELLKNQEIEKIKSDSQTRILNATIDGEESERKQIAETLHDSVSALLSSANMHLQATRKQFNGNTPTEIDKTQKLIEEASHKVRDLSHNLVSSVLLKFGLNFAIKDIAEKYSNSILTIDANVDELRRYDQNFEIKMYHIIQELTNNIIKHSQASFALIELKEENNKLLLRISDDGIGFDKTKINLKDGLGINQIDARITMMKGKFHIESSINNGTQISIEVPFIEKQEPNLV